MVLVPPVLVLRSPHVLYHLKICMCEVSLLVAYEGTVLQYVPVRFYDVQQPYKCHWKQDKISEVLKSNQSLLLLYENYRRFIVLKLIVPAVPATK